MFISAASGHRADEGMCWLCEGSCRQNAHVTPVAGSIRVDGDAVAVHSTASPSEPHIFVFPPSSVVPPQASALDLSRSATSPAVQAVLQGVSASVMVLGAAGNDACARANAFVHMEQESPSDKHVESGVVPSALQGLFAGLEAKAAAATRATAASSSAPVSRHGTPREEQMRQRPFTAAAGATGASTPLYSCDVFMQIVDFVGSDAIDLLASSGAPLNSQPVSMRDIQAFTAALPQIDTQRTSGISGRAQSAARLGAGGTSRTAAGTAVSDSAPPTHRGAPRASAETPHVVLDVEDGAFVSGARVMGPVMGPSEAMGALQEAMHARRAARARCDAQWRKHGVEQFRKATKAGSSAKPPGDTSLFRTLHHDDLFTPPSAAAITVVKVAVEQVFRVSAASRPSTAQSRSTGGDPPDDTNSSHELRSVLWLVDVSGTQWLAAAQASGTDTSVSQEGTSGMRAKSAMGSSGAGAVALPPLTGLGASNPGAGPRATSARAHREDNGTALTARSATEVGSLIPRAPLQLMTGLPAAQGLAALHNCLSALSHRDTADTAGEIRRSHPVTRLLEDALGMNSMLVVLGVVGRTDECATALATLSLCDQVSRVHTSPVVNSDPARALVKAYRLQLRHARLALQSAHSLLKRAAKRVRASTRTERAGGVPEDEVRSRVASAVVEAESRAKAEAGAAAAAVAELEALRRVQARHEGDLEGSFGEVGENGELSTARYRSERDKLLARLRDAYDRCAGMADDKEHTLNMLIEAEEEKLALQQGLVQFQVWGDTLSGQLAAAGLAPAAMPGAQEASVAFHTQGGARGVATLSSAAVQDEVARMRTQLGTLQEALSKTKRELQPERLRRASSVAELESMLSGGGTGGGEWGGMGQAVLQHARTSEQLRAKLRAAEDSLAGQGGGAAPALQAIAELREELRGLKGGLNRDVSDAGVAQNGIPPGNIPPWLWYSPPWAWGGGGNGPIGPGGAVGPQPFHTQHQGESSAGSGELQAAEAAELQRLRRASQDWAGERRGLSEDARAARNEALQLQAQVSRLTAELEDARSAGVAVPPMRVAPVSPPASAAGAARGDGGDSAAELARARRTIKELKVDVNELRAQLKVAEEEARKLRALPGRLSAEADESTMLGQLQRSEKNGVELQTKVIMLQAELANASRQVKMLLGKLGGKKRR